jgi:hypothetical protein
MLVATRWSHHAGKRQVSRKTGQLRGGNGRQVEHGHHNQIPALRSVADTG